MEPTESARKLFFEGLTLFENEKFPEAEARFRHSLALVPGRVSTLTNLSSALIKQGKFKEAAALLDEALALHADDVELWQNRGIAASYAGDFAKALECFRHVIARDPANCKAFNNLGNALKDMRRYRESLDSFDRAIGLCPDYPEAHMGRGNLLKAMYRHPEALESYRRSLALRPEYADALLACGNLLMDMHDYAGSIGNYDRALALRPELAGRYVLGDRLHARMRICDWAAFEPEMVLLAQRVASGDAPSSPYSLVALTSDPECQRRVAEAYVADRFPANPILGPIGKRQGHDRIRIGYFSANFHDHAIPHLMAGLFELHDRSRFELVGFSYGPDQQDGMRQRVAGAFDRFLDVREKSELEVAMLARELEIDIAVDLMGHTQDSRPAIFACRAAPVQVSYLGYPGTMGASYMDYLVADTILIPGEVRAHYAEKIVYLPGSYQVNDANRKIADRNFTREELGLPANGFVFCCFNNNFKITPATFDAWMRILEQVPGSVLWLLEANATATGNLQREASNRGVDPGRLVFARRLPPDEHLARHRAAGLFLDTLPYNAHTTASDALWAGLPVLTLMDASFASRVAASLLRAVGLPDLIASDRQEYEALAIELATSPGKLTDVKSRLAQARPTAPLFNTELFARQIEAAFAAMHRRSQNDLPPADIGPQAPGDP